MAVALCLRWALSSRATVAQPAAGPAVQAWPTGTTSAVQGTRQPCLQRPNCSQLPTAAEVVQPVAEGWASKLFCS